MRRIVSVLVNRPGWCIAVTIAITAALATQFPHLKVNVTPRVLMVGGDPAIAYYESQIERFGTDELTLIVIKAGDVFTPEVLATVERLSDAVAQIPEVTRVDSLTTVNDIRGEGDWVSSRPLVRGAIPQDRDELQSLRAHALRSPVLVGTVLSADAKTTAIVIYSEGDSADPAFNKRFCTRIDELLAAEHGRSGLEMYQLGKPYTQLVLAETLIDDQAKIWPVFTIVLTAVVMFMLRSPYAVAILMAARLVTVAWAFGMMGLFGFPITLLSTMIPLLLMSIGFTEDVYVVSEYYNRLVETHGDRRAAIRGTMHDLATPLLVTSATTAVGFASLALGDVIVVQQLGMLAPLAFTGSFVVSLLLVPALLYYAPVPARPPAHAEAEEPSRLTAGVFAIGRWSVRNRKLTLVLAGCVFVVFASAIRTLEVDNDVIRFFRHDSEIRQRADDVHERLAGSFILYVIVDTHREGGAIEPDTLTKIAALQGMLSHEDRVDKTFAVTDFLETINREMNGGDDAFFVLPHSKDLAAQYLVMLHETDTEKYVSSDYSAANVIVRHDITSTRKTADLVERIDAYAAEHMRGLEVRVTAETILTTNAADAISVNMLQDLALTIVVVGIICSLFFMSVRAGLLSLIPNVLPVAIGFGLLGIFGVPINIGTSLIAAIAIGIAIDDTVHYMARNAMELDRHHEPEAAMIATVRAEGPAIVTTAFALSGGFLVLVMSSFMPLVEFGAVSAMTMMIALVADLTVTPALMASTRLLTMWNVVGTKLRADITEVAPLFRGFTPWEARKVVLLGKLARFEPEAYVIRKGEMNDRAMYMVLTGKVRVMIGSDGSARPLCYLLPGQVFGEMALVDGRERSADVLAEDDTDILMLRPEDLTRLKKRFPRTALKLFENMSAMLSERVRSLTITVAETR
jgi:predicted RND superfamily exporter protein